MPQKGGPKTLYSEQGADRKYQALEMSEIYSEIMCLYQASKREAAIHLRTRAWGLP